MAYVTSEEAAKYTTYEQYELLLAGIHDLEVQLDIKMTGGEDTEANSSPIWGDVAIISANYDESFFIRWVCKDPKGRDLSFLIQVNDGEYFEVTAWFNGINYTCFVPKGHAKVGVNTCRIMASNGLYSTESKVFSVEIPKVYVPQPPNISQDIQNVEGKVGTAVKLPPPLVALMMLSLLIVPPFVYVVVIIPAPNCKFSLVVDVTPVNIFYLLSNYYNL